MKRGQFFLCLCAVVALAGCIEATEVEGPARTLAAPDEQESIVSRGDIAGTWNRDESWFFSTVLDAPVGANRVGVLVELDQSGEMPVIEAQLYEGGEPVSEWTPLEVTWSETVHHVAVVDFSVIGDSAKLRLAATAIDSVRMMQWNAVIPGEPGEADASGSGGGDVVADGVSGGLQTAEYGLATDLADLGIVSRTKWGARATRCTAKNTLKTKMAVHYTVTPSTNPAARVRAIQAYHQDSRGWCDIGYHFLIGVDGTIYEGRPLDMLGAHVSNNNAGNIGISLIGCFHSSGCGSMGPIVPPEAMIEAAGRLMGTLSRRHNIALNTDKVRGHRDFPGASTDCPGDNAYVRLADMRAIGVNRGLDAPATEPPIINEPPAPPATCESLTCGSCETAPGCEWCAAEARCLSSSSACAWAGDVGTTACWDALWPCSVGTCWNPTANLAACGQWATDNDFTSGSFNTHRYWMTIPGGSPVTLELRRSAGNFAPALLVADRAGKVIFGGANSLHPSVAVSNVTNGRSGDTARVTLTSGQDVDVYVYVTGWQILDAGFKGTLPKTSKYHLSASQNCAPPPVLEPPPTGVCSGLACGQCEGSAGCSWCAARGECADSAGTCAWSGEVGTMACWDALWPCAVATCWDPTVSFATCGTWSRNEDYSSGSFSVHRYFAALPGGGPVTIRMQRTAGTYAPALLITDRAGKMIVGGEAVSLHPDVAVTNVVSGRTGATSEVTLYANTDMNVYVYVTSWAILDANFTGSIPTSAKYSLSAVQDCSGGTAPPVSTGTYAGLTQSGSEIPRFGLYNPTLHSVLGVWNEPYGEVVDYNGESWVRGSVSSFGGPNDTGVSSTETGAVSGENLRGLNNPLNPSASALAANPNGYYYVAMRWNYTPGGTSFWKAARLTVKNPSTGKTIVVRPVDWGPNTNTARTLDLSPQALKDLGLQTDDLALVAFAPPGTTLGVVP